MKNLKIKLLDNNESRMKNDNKACHCKLLFPVTFISRHLVYTSELNAYFVSTKQLGYGIKSTTPFPFLIFVPFESSKNTILR